jgi:hypothetical protein
MNTFLKTTKVLLVEYEFRHCLGISEHEYLMLEFAGSAVIPATSVKKVDEKRKKSGERGRRRRGWCKRRRETNGRICIKQDN